MKHETKELAKAYGKGILQTGRTIMSTITSGVMIAVAITAAIEKQRELKQESIEIKSKIEEAKVAYKRAKK